MVGGEERPSPANDMLRQAGSYVVARRPLARALTAQKTKQNWRAREDLSLYVTFAFGGQRKVWFRLMRIVCATYSIPTAKAFASSKIIL